MSTLTVTLPKKASIVNKQLTFVAPFDYMGISAIYDVFKRGVG